MLSPPTHSPLRSGLDSTAPHPDPRNCLGLSVKPTNGQNEMDTFCAQVVSTYLTPAHSGYASSSLLTTTPCLAILETPKCSPRQDQNGGGPAYLAMSKTTSYPALYVTEPSLADTGPPVTSRCYQSPIAPGTQYRWTSSSNCRSRPDSQPSVRRPDGDLGYTLGV
jgi:hypothetical protein